MGKIEEIIDCLKKCNEEFSNSIELTKFVKSKLKDYDVVTGDEFEIKGVCSVLYYVYELDIFIIVQEDIRELDEEDPDAYVSFIKDIKIYKNNEK